jgi:hypothetical protein
VELRISQFSVYEGNRKMKAVSTLTRKIMMLTVMGLAAGCMGVPGIRTDKMRDWTIILPADAIESEQYAAEELRTFFEQATGIALPITNETSAVTGGRIFVGAGEAMRASAVGFDTAGMGSDDLRVVVGKRAIAIAGGRPRGTLYGVYTFLEDAIGVRFLTPDHTYVPRLPRDFAFTPMDKSYSPPVGWRYHDAGENVDYVFAVRRRLNYSFGTIPERLGGEFNLELINHSYGHLLPWARYGKEHPEYFDERDGKRPTETKNDNFGPGVQPCMTNPDVRRIITEGVLADIARHPQRGNVSVSMNDNHQFCTCAKCKALDDAAGSNMGATLDLVNEVADVVAERHPGVMVGTLAYYWTRKPPVNVLPRKNVQIQLCSIEACQMHALDDPECPLNRGFCADLIGWGKLTKNVYIWHYTANFRSYLIPLPLLRSVGAKIRFSVQNNARGLFMQGPGPGANLGGLRNYLICNLLWNPTRDENELIDEFLTLHYGSQAGAVREYIDIIHDAAEASGKHQHCFGGPADYGITPEVTHRALAVLENAMAATDDEILRTRLERETLGCYAAFVDPVAPLVQKHGPAPTDADKQATRPYIGKFLELCRKHNATMYSNLTSVAVVEEGLRKLYGLGKGDEW